MEICGIETETIQIDVEIVSKFHEIWKPNLLKMKDSIWEIFIKTPLNKDNLELSLPSPILDEHIAIQIIMSADEFIEFLPFFEKIKLENTISILPISEDIEDVLDELNDDSEKKDEYRNDELDSISAEELSEEIVRFLKDTINVKGRVWVPNYVNLFYESKKIIPWRVSTETKIKMKRSEGLAQEIFDAMWYI